MSETIIETSSDGSEPIGRDDLERMLAESRTRTATVERERDEERGTRQRVERERDEVATQVKSAAELRYAAEVSAVEQAHKTAEAAVTHAKAAYRKAMDDGDSGAASEAQEAIADAVADRKQAVQRKTWLDTNKEQLTKAPPTQRTEAPQPTGKYAQYVGELRSGEAEWLDARPGFMSDAKYRSRVFGASQLAGADHDRGSAEYFRRMEEILGEGRQEPQRETRQARQPSADLPAGGHRAPGAPQSGSREIRLSADEAEIANSLYGNPSTDMYIADEADRFKKYAANRERMRARNN